MRPYLAVVDLIDPAAEPFAVISIDPTVRVGSGVRAIVQSLHWTRDEAERAASPNQERTDDDRDR